MKAVRRVAVQKKFYGSTRKYVMLECTSGMVLFAEDECASAGGQTEHALYFCNAGSYTNGS